MSRPRFNMPRGVPFLAQTLVPAFLLALLALPLPAQAKGSITKVETEFEKAIRKVTPTTVVCLPYGVDPKKVPPNASSGVVVSRKGYILSDGDVGVWYDIPKGKRPAEEHVRRSDDLEIRISASNGRGFKSYRAKVVRRSRELDSTLIRLEKAPSGLKYLSAGNSDDLKVGDFAFVMGNSFGLASEAAPTLTAGIIASLVPRSVGVTVPAEEKDSTGETVAEGGPEEAPEGGTWQHIYTSAAVNPGVNGGPLVDARGRLIGTISSAVLWGGKEADDPELGYAYMGKVVPMARIKALYRDLPAYKDAFPDKRGKASGRSESAALALVFHHTARKAYRSVVSLEIKRKEPLDLTQVASLGAKPYKIPRYLGPVSGVLISQDGFVLTSLYNLANISTIRKPWWTDAPAAARVHHGVENIESIGVYLPDGRRVEAKVVSYHEGIGVALLKADMLKADIGTGGEIAPGGTVTSQRLLSPVPKASYESGRFLLALGNPFGPHRLDDPLLTVGILAKQHAIDSTQAWAGQWQTDAGVTDGNCGGAAVDLRGQLYGILTIWTSTEHGRNSGIGFVIPWPQIEAVLGQLKRGRSFRRPFFGISWAMEKRQPTTVLAEVTPESAAAKAGLAPGDKIIEIDGREVRGVLDIRVGLRGKWSGDTVVLRVLRAGKELEVKVLLGGRD